MHPVSIWPNEYTRSVDIWYANKQRTLGKFASAHIRDFGPWFAWKWSLKVKRISGN